MSDATSTTTPAPATSTPAPDYSSAFPSMAKEAPTARPVDPAEITYREAFPSMFERKPAPAAPDPAEGTMYRAAVKPGAPGDTAAAADEARLADAFPSMAPPALTADAPGSEAPAAEGRTVTFKDVGDVTVPSALHLDPGDLSALAQAARELRLDAPATQRLIDMHARATANLTAAADAAWSETVQGWRSAVQADPEVGGARFDSTVAEARATIARFGTPELKEALNSSGLGSHPEMVRLMVRVGRALADAEGKADATWQRVGRSLYGR